MTEITKKEFCEAIKTDENNWIFEKVKKPVFKKYLNKEGSMEYYFDDGVDSIHLFKDMPEYGEIWVTTKPREGDHVFLYWGTWSVYD